MNEPLPQASRSSLVPWLVASIAAAFAVTLGVLLVVTTDDGGGPTYTEAAHQLAVEQALGHPVSDWQTYLEIAHKQCGKSTDELKLALALRADASSDEYAAMVASLRHLCLDRTSDVVRYEQDRADTERACRNPVNEEDRMLKDAIGC